MRVMWFTGVQLPVLIGQGSNRAGWQENLRKALEVFHPEIELGIAAFSTMARGPVVVANAKYYTLQRKTPKGKWANFIKGWQHTSYSPEDLDACLSAVGDFKPDLVHFHGTENFFGLISEKLSIPSVLSIQAIMNGLYPFLFIDQGIIEITKKLMNLDFVKGRGPIHRWCTLDKYRLIEKRIIENCNNFMGRTEWDRALLLAFNPHANYYHCDEVLSDIFYSTVWKPGKGTDSEVIYSTSSNAIFKGGLTLVTAIAILRRRGWRNIKLRLGGVDPNGEVGKLIIKIVQEQNLYENILLLGRLSHEQILNEMLKAKAFVYPSHMDNSPNSLCEAMLIGMPCIASNVGGIPSLITHEMNGLLYHDRDPYILAEKIAQILSNQTLAIQLGSKARQTALVRHDRQSIANRTVQIYRTVAHS